MARLLKHRIDIDMVPAKYARQRCNDSRPVPDDESHILRRFKIACYLARNGRWAMRPCRSIRSMLCRVEKIGDHSNGGRISSRPGARESDISTELPGAYHQILASRNCREWGILGHKGRFYNSVSFSFAYGCGGNLPDGAAQVMCVLKVEGPNIPDGTARHLFRSDFKIQTNARQDHQLGSRIQTVDVIGGISLRESCALRLAESFRKRNTRLLDPGQDVIAGPVENATNLG